jgi:hypothetical protein
MRGLKKWIVITGYVLLMASDTFSDGYSPRVGEVHPDFVLPRVGDREPVSLSQFRGRKVLLVHMASW